MTETLASRFTLRKEERICSRLQIEELFSSGRSASLTTFPLRIVYLEGERKDGDPALQMLVSVPKRHLKHAVDRNRVKRQVREAYRKHKHQLAELMESREGKKMSVAFLWLDGKLHPSDEIDGKVGQMLTRICERLCKY